MLYVIIHETAQKTCWYNQGLCPKSIPLNLPGNWNIVAINQTHIRLLTPALLCFFTRCRAWAQARKWSRGLARVRQRELTGRLPCPSRSPQWHNLEELYEPAEEVAGSMFLDGRLQRPSRMLPSLLVRPQTTQDLSGV